MSQKPTKEEQAYADYRVMCQRLQTSPADRESWRKVTDKISANNYSFYPHRNYIQRDA